MKYKIRYDCEHGRAGDVKDLPRDIGRKLTNAGYAYPTDEPLSNAVQKIVKVEKAVEPVEKKESAKVELKPKRKTATRKRKKK